MHASNILSHRMFVAALSPGPSEPGKPALKPRQPPRQHTIRDNTTRAAKHFVELTARPLRELDFGNE